MDKSRQERDVFILITSPCGVGNISGHPPRHTALCVDIPTSFRPQPFSLISYMCNLKGQMPTPELANSN